jgi:hypothetical protein
LTAARKGRLIFAFVVFLLKVPLVTEAVFRFADALRDVLFVLERAMLPPP